MTFKHGSFASGALVLYLVLAAGAFLLFALVACIGHWGGLLGYGWPVVLPPALLGMVVVVVMARLCLRREQEELEQRAAVDLQRCEHNFRELVENSLVGIMLIQDGEIVYQNPEQQRLLGKLPRSFNLEDFAAIHPDDLSKVRESYRAISHGPAPQVDLDFRLYSGGRRREGKMVWVYCRARPITFQGRRTLLVSMIDITRAKELEQLVRIQDKMSSLGRAAAGIAHEIRNPLSGINIYLDTLQRIYGRPEQQQRTAEIFQRLGVASARIEAVIRRVIDFSRPGQLRKEAADLNEPVSSALALAAGFLEKYGVQTELSITADLPRCLLDRQQIEQVLLNLLTNSAEAMAAMPPGAPRRLRVRTLLSDRMVEVRVDDSGPGIAAGEREKIFDPFYTTKPEGTGIGLNLSRRIIGDHGGRLEIGASELGGACFRVLLPLENGTAGKT